MDLEKINQIRERIAGRINQADGSILIKFPVSEYIKLCDRYPAVHDYQYLSPEIKLFTKKIIQSAGENILELYHRIVLLDLIKRNAAALDGKDLPESIKHLFRQNFERILADIESNTQPAGFYLHKNDKFLKDWGVCAGWIIPAGACKVNADRISKRFLFKKDIGQFIRGLWYVIFRLHGFKPIYNMHTDSHDPSSINDYTEDGFKRFFIRVAHLLKLNPKIKGIYCIGWLNDPQLAVVSPRLSYARRLFTDNGGISFYIGTSQSAVENATMKSATRRKLFEEGKYIPIEYLLIWRRKEILSWADRFTRSTAEMITVYNLSQDKLILDAARIREKLLEKINKIDAKILQKFPVTEYLRMTYDLPMVEYYHYLSPALKEYTQNIIGTGGEKALDFYHQLILIELIIRNTPVIMSGDLPDSIKSLFVEYYQTITANIESEAESAGFYLHQNDKYFKIFCVCTMRFIPAGSRKIKLFRLPKKFLIKKGFRQFIEGLTYLLFDLRGFKPFYRMHLDSYDKNSLGKFNPQGYHEFYLNIAALLRKEKKIKGIYGIAWYYDPKLSEINDRFDYLRNFITENGGRIYYSGSDEDAVRNALEKSSTRNRLYKEGKYIPTNYMVVWGRKRILEWADKISRPQNLQ